MQMYQDMKMYDSMIEMRAFRFTRFTDTVCPCELRPAKLGQTIRKLSAAPRPRTAGAAGTGDRYYVYAT